jgi:hypothetical protein
MSLERKDIRAKLDPKIHAALVAICEADRIDIGEFVEHEIEAVIRRRVHDANVLADKTSHLGITGNRREKGK